ncbi:Guanosine-3',5'-bis(diphosphate) 3'-pyrophosphohydrolase / GTP pyrophosphokinase, (p)ppGpp synthetase II [hydrothermal vent metagenome]|uniref:Guanosine-3',5'-bis(Diphosphate) 3'-pyrophosphohydrolase / GTP pyrophosphokinase, (P)ppGpp synthetase II n=1 Tax=hydrothermal vent metagenome TaxID=652676 RepID=A0A3B0ZSS2_9ZZZZ
MLDEYLEQDQVTEIYQAYLFSAEAHEGQHRVSGEAYIFHPLSVAQILTEMRMDHRSIIAALLHDVIEDTEHGIDTIKKKFGEEVATLVDGVSKLTHIKFESKAEAQAENFRKMMLAMVEDIRVILIKLADRLHNMRTLGVMRPDKRRRIALETLEIYAPIANRLGMNQMRLELEDLGFKAMYPLRSRILKENVRKARGNRKELINKLEQSINTRLDELKLSGEIIGRQKHLYSIYKKMHNKKLSFHEVMDVYAIRVVVDSVDMCYRMLGAIHNLFTPVPGKFKDYIAIPKANGYQSLHTVLYTQYGVAIEVQIRTEDMDRVAEAGIAAHWLYKSGFEVTGDNAQVRAREWLRGVLEIQQHAGNSMEFLENVKIDLFPDEVYVFTPSGDIMVLPRGATAIDFAYAVHTDVGNQCVAVKINRRLMPLRTELYNGQTIEVITAPGAQANPSWLEFVKTAKARTNIRALLKNLQFDESVELGRRLINRNLEAFGSSLEKISDSAIANALKEFNFQTFNDLCAEVGIGNHIPMMVARALVGSGEVIEQHDNKKGVSQQPLAIQGTEGAVVSFAKCCLPIPGDNIIGFISAGRGIVVHSQACKNLSDFKSKPEKWIDVEWEPELKRDFSTYIRLMVRNQRGVLATIAAIISDLKSNILNVDMEERDGIHSSMTLTVEVKDRKHLARIMRRLKAIDMVDRIHRIRQ